jgi:rubrerythrin
MSIRIDRTKLICAIVGTGLLAGCTSKTPPPLPQGNPADATIRVPTRTPDNLLLHGMQHREMTMEDHKETPPQTNADAGKKAVADEMKKTSDAMKQTSEVMKEKSGQTNSQDFYYTCRMHPQIHADKPGKCPICGMTLIKKEGAPPK